MKSRLLIAACLVVAACGSSSQSTAAPPGPAAARIAVATNAKLGQILVDGKGITVYLFVKDTGTTPTCYTSSAQVWPPVLTSGPPQAGTGATASLLGTTTRTDGKVEGPYPGDTSVSCHSTKKPLL